MKRINKNHKLVFYYNSLELIIVKFCILTIYTIIKKVSDFKYKFVSVNRV